MMTAALQFTETKLWRKRKKKRILTRPRQQERPFTGGLGMAWHGSGIRAD
jgi:hypothetical protein